MLPSNIIILLKKIRWRMTYIFIFVFSVISNKKHSIKFYCPICEKYSKFFIPAGKRSNAICPICGSRERHRLLWFYLITEMDIQNNEFTILHIAPKFCINSKLKNLKNIIYFAGDKFEKGYSYNKNIIHLNISDLEFKNNKFDLIICIHVLEHIIEDRKAISELFRVLKPGGKAFIMVPLDENIEFTIGDLSITNHKKRKQLYGQWDHVRLYGRDFIERLNEYGFWDKIECFNYNK